MVAPKFKFTWKGLMIDIIFILFIMLIVQCNRVFGQGEFVQIDQITTQAATSINFNSDGDRLVTLQNGIALINQDTLLTTPVWQVNEQGLLNCVEYEGYYYLHVSTLDTFQRILRYDPEANSFISLLQVDYTEPGVSPPYSSRHRGGGLAVKDGILYAGFGIGFFGDRAQDPDDYRGKIVALDLLTEVSQIFAYGVRNPFRIACNGDATTIWETDPGTEIKEEVNLIDDGWNMGYPCYEGTVLIDNSSCPTGLKFPKFQYTQYPSRSIIGGAFFNDEYWWTDLYTGVGGRVSPSGVNTPQTTPKDIVGMATDPTCNKLFALTYGGKIYEWVPTITGIKEVGPYSPYGKCNGYIDILGIFHEDPIPGQVMINCATMKRVFILE